MSAPDSLTGAGRTGGVLDHVPAAFRLLGLGVVVVSILGFHRTGLHGAGPLSASGLLAGATASWGLWVFGSDGRFPPALLASLLGVMGVTGAALTAFVPLAMVFPAVAALAAASALPARRAAAVVVASGATLFIACPATGEGAVVAAGGAAAILAGSVMGLSRRHAEERDRERARTEVLAARNHLARELHDVLAHTLSALSLQLQALDALMPEGPPNRAAADQLDRIKHLVRDGMEEAKGAVAALREDLPPLDERIAKLAAERGAGARVSGAPRPLPPEVALALYRVAQEGVTNAIKHAPGEPVSIDLAFSDKGVTLTVSNPLHPAGPDAAGDHRGGGYGLQGIRERVLLIGGTVEAGPTGGVWVVEARVPVAA